MFPFVDPRLPDENGSERTEAVCHCRSIRSKCSFLDFKRPPNIRFGLGTPSIVFVIVHSVLWAVALNTLTGFRGVPETLRLSGRNYGLRGIRYVGYVLVPAAFPAILAGLKIGWAFAWRTLVAAELVFGVSSRSGGLGWYVFEARAELDTPKVFAGLFSVILIGLLVESVIFRAIEYRTVQRWGMQN